MIERALALLEAKEAHRKAATDLVLIGRLAEIHNGQVQHTHAIPLLISALVQQNIALGTLLEIMEAGQ